MAEYVQQSVEEMLHELEQMERVGLFTGIETRKIMKKRTGLEYKLRRRTKCKEDFLRYIQYEVNVLQLIKSRRKKIGYFHKTKDIDDAVVTRIHTLFRLVTNRFPDDVKLWLSNIEFSQNRNEKSNVSRIFNKMLQIHNNKPDLWILAAKWEWETNASPENARHLLQMGLRYLKTDKHLWVEYFRMELLFTEKMRQRISILGIDENMPEIMANAQKPQAYPSCAHYFQMIRIRSEAVSDHVLEGCVAEVVYKKAIEEIPDDVDFIISFLPVCQLFDFTPLIHEHILTDLRSNYIDKPQTWDALARQHLYTDPTDIEKFHKVYEEALMQTVVSKDVLWKYYLTTSLELIEENSESQAILEKRIQKVLSLFQRASEEKHLSKELYLKWIQLLTNVGLIDTAIETIKEGVSYHAKSVLLWKHYLMLMITSTSEESDVLQVFKESLKHVPEKESLEIWKLLLDFCVGCQSQHTEEMFEKGITCCKEVSTMVKEYYLQWLYLIYGIQKTRKLFKRLTHTKPVSLKFFHEYVKIENSQTPSMIQLLRKAYETALLEYGSTNADLWIDLIKLEMTHPNGKPENIGNIHCRAVKQLDGELNQQFITQFTLIQTGHVFTP